MLETNAEEGVKRSDERTELGEHQIIGDPFGKEHSLAQTGQRLDHVRLEASGEVQASLVGLG